APFTSTTSNQFNVRAGGGVNFMTSGSGVTVDGQPVGSGGCCSGTPISSAPFTITQPGFYYLSANITVSSGNAIIINADGVTLNLNGFTISSTDPNNVG